MSAIRIAFAGLLFALIVLIAVTMILPDLVTGSVGADDPIEVADVQNLAAIVAVEELGQLSLEKHLFRQWKSERRP